MTLILPIRHMRLTRCFNCIFNDTLSNRYWYLRSTTGGHLWMNLGRGGIGDVVPIEWCPGEVVMIGWGS